MNAEETRSDCDRALHDYYHSCPRCESTLTTYIGTDEFNTVPRDWYVCLECGLMFAWTDPRELNERLNEYYQFKIEEGE